MAKLIALYKHPNDAAKFDEYYYSKHVPLAKRIGGLKKYEVSAGPVATPQGASPYHLVATLEFASMQAIVAALGSPEGQATAADLGNFTSAGVDLLVMETREI